MVRDEPRPTDADEAEPASEPGCRELHDPGRAATASAAPYRRRAAFFETPWKVTFAVLSLRRSTVKRTGR